jgi:O-antigen/teichoic acid export membrane protein
MTGWFEMFVLVVSGLLVTPILISYFGKEGYGVWVLVGSIVGYFGLLDLGVSNSVSRFIAKYDAREDKEGLARVITNSIFLSVLSAFSTICITLIIFPYVADFFNLSGKYHKIVSLIILITGAGVAISLPLRIGQGIFQGIHRFDVVYSLRSLGLILKLLLIIGFFHFLGKGNLVLLAVISISASVLPNVAMLFLSRKYLLGISIKRTYISWFSISEIWSLSFSALIISLAAIFFNQTQILAIGKIRNVEVVTLYAVPVMLMTYGSMLISYIIAAFVPLASAMDTLSKEEKLRDLNIQGVKISFVASLALLVMAAVFGKPFLVVWLQSKSLNEADFIIMHNLLLIMTIAFCIGAPQSVTNKMFLGSGKQWFVAVTSVCNSFIAIVVGYLLLKYSTLGLYGMAIGWALFYVISGIVVYPIAACRKYKMSLFYYVKKAYVSPIISAIPLLLVSYLIRKNFPPASFLPLGLGVLFSISIYSITIYYLCFSQEQRVHMLTR